MKPVRELCDELLALQASGLKPFQIVKRVLTSAGAGEVAISGTLNDCQLVFKSGEAITFDGKEWRYLPADPEDAS